MAFSVEFDGLKEAVMFLRKAPRKMNRAMAFTVTEQARKTKMVYYPQVVDSTMEVRSQQFVKSSFNYTRAPLSGKSPHMASAGSFKRENFSGWAEQEHGRLSKKNRAATLQGARRGSFQNRMVGKSRMKKTNIFKKPSEYKANSKKNQVVSMLRTLARQGYKGGFIIRDGWHPKIPGGLYKFRGRKNAKGYRKLQPLQYFDPGRPKKVPISRYAVKMWSGAFNPDVEWGRAVKFVYGGR